MSFAEWKTALRLVASHMWQRPGRVFLTSLSTAAAACVVVWVVSGYDSLVGEFGSMGEEYVGRYDFLLVPARDREAEPVGFGRALQIPKAMLEKIRQDPAIAALDPIFETALRANKPGAAPAGRFPGMAEGEGPPARSKQQESGPKMMGGVAAQRAQSPVPIVVGTDSLEPIHRVLQGQWIGQDSTARVGALTREAAQQLGLHVGDEMVVGSGFGANHVEANIKVVAIVEQSKRLPGPKFMVGLPPTRQGVLPGGPAPNALYVPMAVAEQLAGITARASYAGVVLKAGENVEAFQKRWAEAFGTASPPIEVRTPAKVDSEVDNSTTFESVRAQAYSATGISLLAALFIIFTTLSMGVDERIRQFAMLRAICFTKWQIGLMVAVESLFLGLIGWIGGLVAGWALLALMARIKPELLAEGAALGTWCILLSGICALGGSLAASLMPAWRATSVSPLEAMAPRRSAYQGRIPWMVTIIGLLLIAANPLVVFFVPMPDTSRYLAAVAIGCTTMVIGFVLLAPMAIVVTERLLGPILARLFRINSRLLATQLSANMWRTVGTTVAMTIGLGLFVATQTWGYSMLAPFTPGDWTPDLVISIMGGLSDSQVEAVRNAPGLASDRFAPLAIKQVKFADDPVGFRIRESSTRQDNCVMIGVDPEVALGGAKPLFKFQFVEGNREDAIAKLMRGRYCIVPDHFTRESGIGVGGKFAVVAPGRLGERIDYEIAGVVSMAGWHWMTKTGFRQGRAAGLMFCDRETVRRDFNTGKPTTFWADRRDSASDEELKAAIQSALGRGGAVTAGAGSSFVPEATADAPERAAVGAGRRSGFGRAGGGAVTVKSADSVRKEIRGRADNIIWALSELPLITLFVASLGVMNTVMASIRARRWEMGVLRSLGVTRFGLFRLIAAEALLFGVVACVLSLGFGTMAGYCGTGVTRYVNIRGGQYTPLMIPWAKLSIGFCIAIGLCLGAALWPAFRTGRTDILRLLQSGRGGA